MLWVRAFHIVAMVAWFAGLFYLPRLMVYHADTQDKISLDRFKIMERRLYYGITWPAAVITSTLGVWLISQAWYYYAKAGWMHAKLGLVGVLWVYHLSLGHFVKQFKLEKNQKNSTFFRIYNEMPTFLLITIVVLVVVKPS